jgi:hypothetical protein
MAGVPIEVEDEEGMASRPEATVDAFTGRPRSCAPFDRAPRPGPRARPVWVRLHARDVQAEGAAALGLLRAAVLHGDALVGKVDATADRDAGTLRVDAIHEDVPFTPGIRGAVDAELAALARWLGLDEVTRA